MKLSAWRKKNELTQAELAELLGSNQGHISELESGAHKPKLETMLTVSRITKGKVTLQDWAPVIAEKPKRKSLNLQRSVKSDSMEDSYNQKPRRKK